MENIRNWLKSSDIKGKSLWVYDKILEFLLIACLLLAMAFTSTIEFLRQGKFKKVIKDIYKKPFSYLPNFNFTKKNDNSTNH